MMLKQYIEAIKDSRFFSLKLTRYLFSGGTAAIINLGLVWILEKTGMHYILVVTLSYTVSLIAVFLLQKFFTFKNSDVANIHGQFLTFVVLAIVNLLVNDFLVYIQVTMLHLDRLILAQAIATVIVAIYSFFIYKVIFRQKHA